MDLEMKAHPKDADADVTLADLPKGERNRNPTDNQYSIKCPSFGLSNCTKTFYEANKWWDIRPLNSDGTSNQISVHWSSHFKGLYDTKEIPHLVLKMTDNHLRNLYCHNILKHGGNNYPYFDYEKKSEVGSHQGQNNFKEIGVSKEVEENKLRYQGKKGCRESISTLHECFHC